MQNEEIRNIVFELEEQENKENDNDRNSVTGNELQREIDIECYDKVMEFYPNYSTIFYMHIRKYMARLKIILSTKFKPLRNINNRLLFVILL